MKPSEAYDALIVGAGPAGLSAALILGRSRRRVLVLDSGRPRNAASSAMHGFLSRDGISPAAFLTASRDQIKRYETVAFRAAFVRDIIPGKFFTADLGEDGKIFAKKILLATGTADEIPAVEGFKEFFGKGVYLCPYCDGWEVKDRPLAVYGKNGRGPGFALTLLRWSRNLVLLSDGKPQICAEDLKELKKHRIRLIDKPLARLEGRGRLERIVFKDGTSLARSALFFNTGKTQKSVLAARLKCRFTQKGGIQTDSFQFTGIDGVYAAGDACDGLKLAITAAAQGAAAAFAINSDLQNEETD